MKMSVSKANLKYGALLPRILSTSSNKRKSRMQSDEEPLTSSDTNDPSRSESAASGLSELCEPESGPKPSPAHSANDGAGGESESAESATASIKRSDSARCARERRAEAESSPGFGASKPQRRKSSYRARGQLNPMASVSELEERERPEEELLDRRTNNGRVPKVARLALQLHLQYTVISLIITFTVSTSLSSRIGHWARSSASCDAQVIVPSQGD